MGEVKGLLQLMQLLRGEGSSDPPLALPLFWLEEGPSLVTLVLDLCGLVPPFQPLQPLPSLGPSHLQLCIILFPRNPDPRLPLFPSILDSEAKVTF